MNTGRVTLPTEAGFEAESVQIAARLGADAVRNSDGTVLPPEVANAFTKAVATYFPARGDNDWAAAHPTESQQLYLLSRRFTANSAGLQADPMEGYFREQLRPNLDDDPHEWWQVMDRTTGQVVPTDHWQVAADGLVTIERAVPFHEYTVAFLAYCIWDPTQMYNHLTNQWGDKPHEMTYDARHPQTWAHMLRSLRTWLIEHPEADVVRFTTFFYHFTLVYNEAAKEKYVDWFGYSASVSPQAIRDFEAEYGYRPSPEDFVDEGYYNSTFRVPSQAFSDWIAFQQRFVAARARELVTLAHDAGREAMMFFGDNWIGTEPYGDQFATIGLDAVVGSVGGGVTLRLISDIPGVSYTEGRFLPYFFPDVFRPGGDPLGETNQCWLQARRAQVRSPLARMGYGGYLSLAHQVPGYIDRLAEITQEFRDLLDGADGTEPYRAPITLAVLNCWGKLRSWQSHMVAHSLPYPQTVAYLGIFEALSGLPIEVRFVSFDDALAGGLAGVDVVLNTGPAGSAWSGASRWADPELVTLIRRFVADGGGLIGVGEPSAWPAGGAYFQLSDVLGVEKERGLTLSANRYPRLVPSHVITADLVGAPALGEGAGDVYATGTGTDVLALSGGRVMAAANRYGAGRSVYLAGLPYSPANSRLLFRAIAWSASKEDALTRWHAADPRIDVAAYPQAGRYVLLNGSDQGLTTDLWDGEGRLSQVQVPAMAALWRQI